MSFDFYQLALHRLLVNQPRKLHALIKAHGNAEAVFSTEPDLAEALTGELQQAVARDIAWLEQADHHLICMEDSDYPELLSAISDPPHLLFATGHREALRASEFRVAMVGARKASRHAISQAEAVAADLAQAGVTVVSGLALGIDAAAHEGSLIAGGTTLAVLGSGPDVVYPKRHWRLAERVCREGLVLSEYPPGTPALPYHFPQRNRIVTGLCQATLVVEAALPSGSLISAKLAASEGREVMAMPGLVTNRQVKGCHYLIREGAQLVESAQDVLLELGLAGELPLLAGMAAGGITAAQQQLLDCLGAEPKSMDLLVSETRLPVEELTVNLVTLEVLGLLTSESGQYQRRLVDRC